MEAVDLASPAELVGRDAELGRALALLDDAAAGRAVATRAWARPG
jgi:hypothetical protein